MKNVRCTLSSLPQLQQKCKSKVKNPVSKQGVENVIINFYIFIVSGLLSNAEIERKSMKFNDGNLAN